jgi:hypothetical protein
MKKTIFVLENICIPWAYVLGSFIGFFALGMDKQMLIANMLVAILIAMSKITYLLGKKK